MHPFDIAVFMCLAQDLYIGNIDNRGADQITGEDGIGSGGWI